MRRLFIMSALALALTVAAVTAMASEPNIIRQELQRMGLEPSSTPSTESPKETTQPAKSLQDQLSAAVKNDDMTTFLELLRKGAKPGCPDSAGKRYFDYSKDQKWFLALTEEFPDGISLWCGEETKTLPKQSPQEPQPRQQAKPTTTFRLTERTYAHDSLQTAKDIWVAAMSDESSDHAAFNLLLNQSIMLGHTLVLPGGTTVALTGRATGIMSEVAIPGRPGKWCIPNHALKLANIPVPPVDDGYMQEQLP